MEYVQGGVVKSLKGHDKDGLFLIVKTEGNFVWLVDGKNRKKHNPKKKNVKHVTLKTYMPEFESLNDKTIRKQLNLLR